MFNGIIYNTGKIKYIKKKINSIVVGIETNLIFKKKRYWFIDFMQWRLFNYY